MRTFLRPRYGCDYCKKVGGSKHHMAKHEASCTANPERVCRMHVFATGEKEAPTMADLIAAQTEGGYKRVCEVSGGCPACKLAVFRIAVAPNWPDEWSEFSFKGEMKSLWDDHNSAAADARGEYSHDY